MSFPFYRQLDHKDCGPTCLRIVSKYYGKNASLQKLRELTETTRQGSSLKGLCDAAETIGFRTLAGQLTLEQLCKEAPLPCILYWNQNHFVVLYKIKKEKFYVSDPAHGLLEYTKKEFIKGWIGEGGTVDSEGIVLLLETSPDFNKLDYSEESEKRNFSFLFKYLFKYKKFLIQLLIGVIAGSFIQLLFPFLTQAIVDTGIQNRDLNFIYLILASQIFLFLGKTGIEILRGWILLHLSARINISLISDFFIKLMNLPISFFDVKLTGDIIQRIKDHQRIEHLLTATSLSSLFSLSNLIIFGAVLAWYNLQIFGLFFFGSLIFVLWIFLFLKKREDLDYKMFSQLTAEQDKVIELISGMQEIKLSNSERQKRWSWEHLQARLFKIQIKGLGLEQTQSVGASIINEFKNILITFLAVTLVIKGEMTIGMMLAVSYIIGQLNYPLLELVRFVHLCQDAKIAFARLSEIHNKDDEEISTHKSTLIPDDNIYLNDVHFRYTGALEHVIKGLNLEIPKGKVTAIVGSSGSGKTTLMKLLLKFYDPVNGEICVGSQNLKNISQRTWREACGVVMQEGYIFNDSIANNIAVGEDVIDKRKLIHAVEVANIKYFIESLPLGYNTKIGSSGGVNISTGEKQRILIARAVYKDPQIIFFDEATSALDAKNERIIMENLQIFFKNRTAIVIAHRLSTVKNADQIVVLDKGTVAEVGTHTSLIYKKGIYYNLVSNQLEIEKLS